MQVIAQMHVSQPAILRLAHEHRGSIKLACWNCNDLYLAMQELMSSRSRIRHHIEKYLPSCVDKYLEHVSQDPDNLRERLYTYSEQLLSVQQTMVMERGGVMRRGTVLGEMTSNELGELILEDNTGRIKCQVSKV